MFTDFDKRMKLYEEPTNIQLKDKTPIILRIDGRAFHTFCKNFERPFDDVFLNAMRQTMLTLCQELSTCLLGYTQSDEISLLLYNGLEEKTQPMFGNRVEKLCSVAASIATLAFDRAFKIYASERIRQIYDTQYDMGEMSDAEKKLVTAYRLGMLKNATFDCRAFNLPLDEVANYFYWRQSDSIRNSVRTLGRSYFTEKEMHNMNNADVIEVLLTKFGISWEKLPDALIKGVFCHNTDFGWKLDTMPPLIKGRNRSYINDVINFKEA